MSTNQDEGRYPQLVAFDLDYTLWDLWIDTHVTGPLRRDKENVNEVLDRYNEKISFYKDVPAILHRLRRVGNLNIVDRGGAVTIVACSRTHAPTLARKCLSLLLVAPESKIGDAIGGTRPATEFFDELEIYPGSKITHFKALKERTGISYSEMLFFDDELRNREVEQLGVTFHHVPNGLTNNVFEMGLEEWRNR